MKRGLKIAIFILAIILAVFMLSLASTESSNNSLLKSRYSSPGSDASPEMISVPAPVEKAYEFRMNTVAVWSIKLIMGFAVPIFFLFSGLSAGIRSWAAGKFKRRLLIIALYCTAYSAVSYLIYLPIDFYSGFIRLHSYGLSGQTPGSWFSNSLKALLMDVVFNTIIVWFCYTVMRKAPKRCWQYIAIAALPFYILMYYISPIFIDPLFNGYTSLKDKALESEIQSQLGRTAINNCCLLESDVSSRTNQMNAYMTGIFSSRRIVLWDTTIKGLTTNEILNVTAHEAGHYLMGHIWKSILVNCIIVLIGAFAVIKASRWVLSQSGNSMGFVKLHDIASLPLLIIMINLVLFILAPASNAITRHTEREADRFALELTQNNKAAARMLIKMHYRSLSIPQSGIVYRLWACDHPELQERVDFANLYRPWEEGKPLKYSKFILK